MTIPIRTFVIEWHRKRQEDQCFLCTISRSQFKDTNSCAKWSGHYLDCNIGKARDFSPLVNNSWTTRIYLIPPVLRGKGLAMSTTTIREPWFLEGMLFSCHSETPLIQVLTVIKSIQISSCLKPVQGLPNSQLLCPQGVEQGIENIMLPCLGHHQLLVSRDTTSAVPD